MIYLTACGKTTAVDLLNDSEVRANCLGRFELLVQMSETSGSMSPAMHLLHMNKVFSQKQPKNELEKVTRDSAILEMCAMLFLSGIELKDEASYDFERLVMERQELFGIRQRDDESYLIFRLVSNSFCAPLDMVLVSNDPSIPIRDVIASEEIRLADGIDWREVDEEFLENLAQALMLQAREGSMSPEYVCTDTTLSSTIVTMALGTGCYDYETDTVNFDALMSKVHDEKEQCGNTQSMSDTYVGPFRGDYSEEPSINLLACGAIIHMSLGSQHRALAKHMYLTFCDEAKQAGENPALHLMNIHFEVAANLDEEAEGAKLLIQITGLKIFGLMLVHGVEFEDGATYDFTQFLDVFKEELGILH